MRTCRAVRARAGAVVVCVRGYEPPLLDLVDFLAGLRAELGPERGLAVVARRRTAVGCGDLATKAGRARRSTPRRRPGPRTSGRRRWRRSMIDPGVPQLAVVGHPEQGQVEPGRDPRPGRLGRDRRGSRDDAARARLSDARRRPPSLHARSTHRASNARARCSPGSRLERAETRTRAPRIVRDSSPSSCAARATRSSFPDECELLRPIVEGAGILYVVDGSVPYGPEYEAEMEILRWTGRPSMAVINPIASRAPRRRSGRPRSGSSFGSCA